MSQTQINTQFFEEGSGHHIATISGSMANSLRKGSTVFLVREDHTKKDLDERSNSLRSSRWKVVSTTVSFREMLTKNNPTKEWPFLEKSNTFVSLEVTDRPYRYWTIGLSSTKRGGKFFEVEHDGRFIRIGVLYIGLGYILK